MKAIIDVIVSAVQVVPRVETKLYSEKPWKSKEPSDDLLHPIILTNITDSARTQITAAIHAESKKPQDHLEKSKIIILLNEQVFSMFLYHSHPFYSFLRLKWDKIPSVLWVCAIHYIGYIILC